MTETKQEALALLEAFRAEWLANARDAARNIAKRKGQCTADDVRQECPVPQGMDGRVMGAVFRSDEWVPGEFINSKRRTCHNRPIRVFRLVGA
ncbi:MAG: hypothetical protein AAGG72_06910 [Pseudomonadota bacterium]